MVKVHNMLLIIWKEKRVISEVMLNGTAWSLGNCKFDHLKIHMLDQIVDNVSKFGELLYFNSFL